MPTTLNSQQSSSEEVLVYFLGHNVNVVGPGQIVGDGYT